MKCPLIALLLTLTAGVSFGQTKPQDLCVPPPAGVAPSLPATILKGQGIVHMAITTSNPKAQEFFDQGLAQLHSFWANEAERSFLQAAALDPEAPMPWWGVAMVAAGDYRPRFQIDRLNEVFGKDPRVAPSRANAAAGKAVSLSEVPGKASDLEKMYIAAVAGRRLPGAKNADDAYIDGLRAIAAKYPQEVDARTFLALHLMRGYVLPQHTPRAGTMEAVAILRQLLIDAPNHPGVHHYVIHGFEGSSFAKDAWTSCQRYSELVTNIPHALHMPGHIYSQTGKWDEAAKAFDAAAENEWGYMKADSLYGTGHHGHNVNYLATAYSFQGKYRKAKQAAQSLLEFKENPRELASVDGFYSAHRQGWFAMLRILVQSESWDEILEGKTLPVYERPREMAWRSWAFGLAHAANRNPLAAQLDAKAMDVALADYVVQAKHKVPPELTVARGELAGQIQIASGKLRRGLQTLDRASQAECKLLYTEPPFYPRPIAEAMGRIAMHTGNLKEAKNAFTRALEQYPASAKSAAGLHDIGQ